MSKNGKRDKFVTLAKSRVNRAISMIRLIGNLGNKSHYDYSKDDAKQIIRALEAEVRNVKIKFESKKRITEEFNLK